MVQNSIHDRRNKEKHENKEEPNLEDFRSTLVQSKIKECISQLFVSVTKTSDMNNFEEESLW